MGEVGGGSGRRSIVRLTGLALCVMNGPVMDADRFVFNTCGCTIRSASRDKLETLIFLFQFIPDNLPLTPSLAAGGGRGH